MSLEAGAKPLFRAGAGPPAVATMAAIQSVNSDPQQHLCHNKAGQAQLWVPSSAEMAKEAGLGAGTTLEDLQPDVLYHILLFLTQQDVAHVKMCSSRLMCNILLACQHWAPKVESWLASDPSSVGLLKQLRGADGRLQPPQDAPSQPVAGLSIKGGLREAFNHPSAGSRLQQQQQQVTALSAEEAEALQGTIRVGYTSNAEQDADNTYPSLSALVNAPGGVHERLDWRQVWSCLERAQTGPWQLDARRLSPKAFPHGVLLTFELLLQQPAPPAEPGAREHQSGGWRDCVTVLTFSLDGKTVEIMVDAGGRVTSPQGDWSQGAIKLEAGQPKLLALEVSYLFPVAAWFLHPCTLAAPKLLSSSNTSSLNSSGSSSSASSMSGITQDANWDTYSIAASSSASSGMSIAHSAALCSAVSSLSFTSTKCSNGSSGAAAGTTVGRPRLCLDLSHGVGSYVSDPRYLDESTRHQRPRGLERLELADRVCWRPSKVQSWLGRLLPGIRAHGCSSSGGSSSSSGSTVAGSGGSISSCVVGSPGSSALKAGSVRPSFAVTVGKAAVWQVPEDPEYRFMEGFEFWAVQHKAEQLLEHYGILPPWQGHATGTRPC